MTVLAGFRSLTSPSPSPAPVTGYRDLVRLGGAGFLPIALIARLPAAMTPLALLAFVAHASGSFALAGLTVTGSALGTAAGAPLMGILADRVGQRRVLLVAAVLNGAALAGLALLGGLPATGLVLLGGLIGLTTPQIGGMSRARWLSLSRRMWGAAGPTRAAGDLARLSMAWEGLADEVAYIVGPALAGLLAALAGPGSALVVAGAVGAFSGAGFALHPTHALTAGHRARQLRPLNQRPERAIGVPALLRRLAVPLAAMTMVGVFFAATQTALTVYAAGGGHPSAGGLLYATMAVSSAISAALIGRLPARVGPRLRCMVAAAGLLTGALAMSLAARTGAIGLVAVAVLFTGVWVSPVLITLNSVVGELAPAARMATAMALVASSVVTGVATGATVAGTLADRFGEQGAFGAAAAALAVLLGLATHVLPRPAAAAVRPG